MLIIIVFAVLVSSTASISLKPSDFTRVADHTGHIDLESIPFSKQGRLGKLHTDSILQNAHKNTPDTVLTVSASYVLCHSDNA